MPLTLNPEQVAFPAFQARLFDSRIGEYLRAPGREAAARRLRHEFSLLTDREAAAHVLEQQIFAADLRLSTLYADQSAARSPSSGRKADPKTVERIENEIAAMRDELSRLRARRASISTRALELRYLAGRKLVLQALSGGSRLKFLPPPSVPKGATLDKVRETIAQLSADLKAVADAPYPASFVRERAAKFIGELARPINVRPAFEGGDIYLPLMAVTAEQTVPDALGVLVWAIGPSRIMELVNKEIDECADEKHALSPDQRAARTAKIKTDILAAERIEAVIEWEMLQEGSQPSLRAEADPRAILGVE